MPKWNRYSSRHQGKPVAVFRHHYSRVPSGVSIMSTILSVGRGRQPSSPFGLVHKKPKSPKKYGANAPQLRAIRYPIDFRVMMQRDGVQPKKKEACMSEKTSKRGCRGAIHCALVALGHKKAKKPKTKKNTMQMRHSCALFNALSNIV